MMTQPNFLVLGVQKAGTTWLRNMLKHHPEIFVPKGIKELMFFDDQNLFKHGLQYYESHFLGAQEKAAIGEVSTSYFWVSPRFSNIFEYNEFRADIPARVRDGLGPNLKLIVTLREPVQRAISAYIHHVEHGRSSFDESILDVGHRWGLLHIGLYYLHLYDWLRIFDRKRLHVLLYEDLAQDPLTTLRKLFTFLSIDPDFHPPNVTTNYNKALDYSISSSGVVVQQEDDTKRVIVSREHLRRLRRFYCLPNEKLSELLPEINFDRWTIQI